MPRGFGKWSEGKAKGADMNNIWFLLEFGHRFKASESGFLGPSYPIPKPTRKPFQIHFISSAIVIVPSKNPLSPGQVGAAPSSPAIPALPSLSSLPFPSSSIRTTICASCGKPWGLWHSCFPWSSHLLQEQDCPPCLALPPSSPPGLWDNS